MKRDISYTILQRLISMVLCLGIILSSSSETDLFDIFSGLNIYAEAAGEMPKDNEYDNETLRYVWDNGGVGDTNNTKSFWNASRPYYTCAGSATKSTFDSFGGVYKRTIFHVFAFEGDTICIGSSVFNSGLTLEHKLKDGLSACAPGDNGKSPGDYNKTEDSTKHYPDKDSVDVVMTDLHGNNIPIDIRNDEENKNFTGYIASPKAEYAAILMEKQSDGTYSGTYDDVTYTPYTYKVTETGVYTFEFHSYDKTGATNPTGKLRRSDQWPTYDHNYIFKASDTSYQDAGGLIAALNLTVFDENGEKQTGRTYADFLSLQMGNVNQGVRDAYYILTTDSYIYKMQFNGASPYTYNFFANNRGIYDDNGKIIYKSVKDITNSNTFTRMGALFRYPGTGDTDYFKSFYIFLEYPDPKLEGYLFEKAVPPDPAKNVKFVSTVEVENENVPGAYVGMGGYFEFDVDEATTATLRLEFKKSGEGGSGAITEDYAPVEISTVVTPHTTNRVYWNGRDGNGEIIPVGTYNMEDIVFTVTTKAGEIHFPIFDMENASGGITFTRLSHIYDKDGKWLDKPGTIYDLTKNVIYYDETAIYYGEKVAEAGISEDQMTLALTKTNNPNQYELDSIVKDFFATVKAEENPTKTFWTYNNLISGGGEFAARTKSGGYINETPTTLGTNDKVRVGDHSHTTNIIQYFNSDGKLLESREITEEQQKMIDYLSTDTYHYPAGKSSTTAIKDKNNNTANNNTNHDDIVSAQTTTDYAIANYWTFIPSKPAVSPAGSTETIQIVDPGDEKLFNLTGRVFYDSSTNVGKFDDGSESGEYLIPGVTLNLYRKTTDTSYQADKTYVAYTGGTTPSLTPITNESEFTANKDKLYERVDTGQTTSDGIYTFTGLKYDSDGTEYVYEVKRPSESYKLTSGGTTPAAIRDTTNNVYIGYYADKSYLTSWKGTEIQHIKVGGDGVDPTKYGYNNEKKTDENNVTVAAVDVGYTYTTMSKSLKVKKLWENGTETRPISVVYEISYSTQNSNVTQNYGYWMLSSINGWSKEDLWLPAQQGSSTVDNYYVSAEYYISGETIYKHTFAYDGKSGKYTDFVGTVYSVSNPDYIEEGSIADINKDGVKDANDYGAIPDGEWKEIKVEDAHFRAVLDKSDSSNKIDVNITNSAASGTVQIFKYKDENTTANALQGATFRIYEGDIATIKGYVDNGNTAELAKCRVGSSTSRDNGLLAFPNLDPTKYYTVREISPPGGYRMLREYYQVVPKGQKASVAAEYKDVTVEFGEAVKMGDESATGEEDVAKLSIGNVLADSNFFIRKRILGRAWQNADGGIPMDSFTFKIENDFSTTGGNLTGSTGITVDTEEIGIQTNGTSVTETDLISKLNEFSQAVNGLNTSDPVTINYNSKYYTAKVTSGNVEYEISTDEKVSNGLIVAGDSSGTAKAAFRGKEFPMAGTYTFTIEEVPPANQGTLQYSKRKYTVEVTVTRKLSKGHESESTITLANSYLEAAVSRITYTDDGGSPTDFASNSPSFVNTYAPAPAKQETTYAISKTFTGRGTSKKEWLGTDEFTINIEGVDSTTQTAIQNKNLSIDGLKSYLNEEVNKWQYTFKNDGTVPFTSFTFKNIEFPVKFINESDKTEWTPSRDEEEPPPGVTAQTMPVEYWLRIYEEIPSETKGITYDTTNYYLHIILRNTFKGQESTDSEEEDGIIDEIDMYLYKSYGKVGKPEELISTTPVATCQTAQQALNESEWKGDAPSDDRGGTFSWWYIDKAGKLQGPVENHKTEDITNAALLIRKWEKHDNEEDHTMPFKNVYQAAVYSWAPTIHKTLTGRAWDVNDKFTFTIACTSSNSANVTLPEPPSITITQSDKATDEDYYAKAFKAITINGTGEYEFTITETHSASGGIEIKDNQYTITVEITDDQNGHLIATFNAPYDSTSTINFTNVYTDTANSFELDISKKIIGRNWESGDSFKFTIKPDDAAKTAIGKGMLEMPAGLTADSEGNYTVTLNGPDTTNEIVKKVGDIVVKSLPEDLALTESQKYVFTISEITDDLDDKKMRCRENDIKLTVNVKRKLNISGLPTGELEVTATYSYMGDTGTKTEGSLSGTDPKAVIPFVNVCINSLTVEKKVVSTSGTDTESFNFTVEFEFDTSKILEAEQNAITSSSVGGITATKKDDNTWTFSLSDGQSVTFNNIPAYTTYKISEDNTDTGYMFLRALDENGTAIETTTTGIKTAMNNLLQINVESPSKVTFVNGRIIDLPSTGGAGINTILLLGMIITAAATATLIILLCKSGKSRDNPNG